MMHKLNSALKAIPILATAAFLYSLIMRDMVAMYIHPRFTTLTLISALGLFLVGMSFFRPGRRPLRGCDPPREACGRRPYRFDRARVRSNCRFRCSWLSLKTRPSCLARGLSPSGRCHQQVARRRRAAQILGLGVNREMAAAIR